METNTVVSKGSAKAQRALTVAQLLALEAQFEPTYVVEGATVILFRNSNFGGK